MLRTNRSLIKLNLGRNQCRDEGVARLSEAILGGNQALQTIVLYGNGISDTGLNTLIGALQRQPRAVLREVDLYGNPITKDGCLMLAEALTSQGLASLELVHLDDSLLGSAGPAALQIRTALERNSSNHRQRNQTLDFLCWDFLCRQGLNMKLAVPEYIYMSRLSKWPPPAVVLPAESRRTCSVCQATTHDKRTCPVQARMRAPAASQAKREPSAGVPWSPPKRQRR
jgi:hypothetical protein